MLALTTFATVFSLAQEHHIESVLQPSFADATLVVRVLKADQRELAKINKDFGQSYRFEQVKIYMKEPFKLRSESNVEDTQVYFILNGTTQLYKIPKARISQKNDLSDAPGRRQTVFDFGVLTPSLFKSLYDGTFHHVDRATGALVFDINYKPVFEDKTRSRIWVDPTKKYIMKREWYDRGGLLRAVFTYENPKQFGHIWAPTKQTVRNVDNKVAGVVQYDALKINTGLGDDLFKVQ